MSSVQPENGAAEAQPSMSVVAQYVKDLSFENPKAPDSLRARETAPQISIGVNVNSRQRSQTDYEIDLHLEAKAAIGEEVIFNVELTYGGLISVQNVPAQHLHPYVNIEGPRLLFPFARQIIADAVIRGGFPPLLIDPIDFVQLYQQYLARLQQMQQQQQGAAN